MTVALTSSTSSLSVHIAKTSNHDSSGTSNDERRKKEAKKLKDRATDVSKSKIADDDDEATKLKKQTKPKTSRSRDNSSRRTRELQLLSQEEYDEFSELCSSSLHSSTTDSTPRRRYGVDRDRSCDSISRGSRYSSSSIKNEKRSSIGHMLRSKNLLSASIHGSSHHTSSISGASDMPDDMSCTSFGSNTSSSVQSSVADGRRRNKKVTNRIGRSPKDVKSFQFAASISSALSSDDDQSSTNWDSSISNISQGVAEMSSTMLTFSDSDRSLNVDDVDNLHSPSSDSMKKTDTQLKDSPSDRKADSNKERRNWRAKGKSDVFGKTIDKEKIRRRERDLNKNAHKNLNPKNPLRSCLKGANNRRRLLRLRDIPKEVHFIANESLSCPSPTNTTPKVHLVKSLMKYSKDLWWSNKEIEELCAKQSDFSQASEHKVTNVQAYMQAYRQGRQQMNYEQTLSENIFQELVTGIKRGYCGIEAHSNLHETICQHIKDTIRSIIKAYVTAVEQRATSATANGEVKRQSKQLLDPSVIVKAHSEALTETDRKWAAAMGLAQQQAAKC